MRRVIRPLLAVLMVGFAVWCALQLRSDLTATSLAPLAHAWNLILAAALLSLVNYLLRAIRWHWYIARQGHTVPLSLCSLAYLTGFAFTLTPGNLGEMARARYFKAWGVPLREVTAAFCMERLLDVVAVLFLAVCCISLVPRYRGVIWITVAVVAALLALGLIAMRLARRDTPRNAVAAQYPEAGLPFFRAASRSVSVVNGVLCAAKPLLAASTLVIGAALGVCAWGLEGFGLYLLGFMFPTAHPTLQVAIGIYAVSILAGAVVLLPGGLGGTEAVMTAMLVSQGLGVAAALLLTLVCRFVTLWLAVCVGSLAILLLRLRRLTPMVLVP